IVPRQTSENVARLLAWLLAHDAYDRAALPNCQLRPTADALLKGDIVRFQTTLGKVNVIVGRAVLVGYADYEYLLPEALLIGRDRIEQRIAAQAHAEGIEDRPIFPVLIV